MKRKEIDDTVDSMRLDMCTDTKKAEPTVSQLRYMNRLVNDALVHPENRYAVVGYIVGRVIKSTYSLTRYEASVIIDKIAGEEGRVSDYGRIFIQALEATVEECPLPI